MGGAYNQNVHIETLRNNVVCAALESPLPISRVAVVVKAGSRYDPTDVPGLSHVLRASAGLTTKGASTFAIIRNLQQMGANLQVTGSRDTITYTIEATSDKIDASLKFLNDVVTLQTFKPWELTEN
ncbi:insulinase family protein, partial [bacterium LRH843]|nr:insulinase family protein [bacterium LRH843]